MSIRPCLGLLGLLLTLTPGTLYAQVPPPPPPAPAAPTLAAPLLGTPVPSVPPPAPGPPAALVYPPPPPAPFLVGPPPPGPLEVYPGIACDPDGGRETLFVIWELEVVKPHVKNSMQTDFTRMNGTKVHFSVPTASLPWTISPSIAVGYRLPGSAGEFSVGYRFLVDEHTTYVNTPQGTEQIKSRLNVNIFDFDYASAWFGLSERIQAKWRLGARLATFFEDTRSSMAADFKQSSVYISAAGPHAGLDLERQFALVPSFSLFGRADAAVLIGPTHQTFERFPDADGLPNTAELDFRTTGTLPVVTLEAGLTYRPPALDLLRFTVGYRFEQWWNVGTGRGGHVELNTQGVFLRGEVDF